MTVLPASGQHVDGILRLADLQRRQYAAYQPQFWRPALDATVKHRAHVAALIEDEAAISFVAVTDRGMAGFAVATLVPAPPVYDPGGLTCLVDDFAVADPNDWPTVGLELLRAVRDAAAQRGAAQIVVVTAHRDRLKRQALADGGLSVASEWWVASV